MLATIVINNYNYARFLPQAIESALAQTHPQTEVIVVDDGSTDHSREIIASYGTRIQAVFQRNRGQAAALNTGFAQARGDIILALDADDLLNPNTVAKVVAAFCQNSDLSKVHWRLQLIDAQGIRLPAFTPPKHMPLPQGELLPFLLRYPDDIPYPPTSGNAYAAHVLKAILPIPECEFRLSADYYLLNLAPFYGPVQALPGEGGKYRVHRANGLYHPGLNLDEVRNIILRTQLTHATALRVAKSLGHLKSVGKSSDDVSVTLLAHRIVSLKLERKKHPVVGDRLLALTLRGMQSSFKSPYLNPTRRVAWTLWFAGVAFLPAPLARRVAQTFYQTQPVRDGAAGQD